MVTVACSSSVNRASPAGQLTTKELVRRSKPAIVRIEASSAQGVAVGTGFVLSPDGHIVTNLHVIQGAEEIRVTLLDGSKLAVQELAAVDPDRDLVVLKVTPRRALPVLALGNSDEVAAGDPVIAIGNPSLTVLQISAPISQGSSGGPLFNQSGEVVGVATAIIGEGQNLNFGIPSNYLKRLIGKNERLPLSALAEPQESSAQIQRRIPNLDVASLGGCSDAALLSAVQSISEAIQIGAPLYNQGNHEACFRIYEGAAVRLERELECPLVREALGQGLLRASTEESFTLKAWAMRDAFDGIILVVERKARGGKP